MSDPEYDTGDWRTLRDKKLMEWIGDPNAVRFIIQFSDACEFFDDVVDQDKPLEEGHAVRVLFTLLTELPVNPFFDRWKGQLIPQIVMGINAWLDANELESTRHDAALEQSFVLRDFYMEIIGLVVYLTRGRDHLRKVSLEMRRFFTHQENLEQYKRKFK